MKKKEISFKFSAVALAVLLAGCGGGGSDGYYGGGTSQVKPDNSNGIQQPTLSALNISDVKLIDTNNLNTAIITSAGVLATVKVTDQNGQPVSGALVTFTGEKVTFGTSNGAVITNLDGIANISVKPLDSKDTGSYKLSASAESNEKTAKSNDFYFSIEPFKTKLLDLTAALNEIDAGGSSTITLKTVDPASNAIQSNVQVNFSANCGTFENNSVLSNQGIVETKYIAISSGGQLCTGPQVISALANNGAISSTVNITVKSIKANSLVYTSNEIKLGTVNSGSSTAGQVEFTVYADNVPAKDQDVRVELINAPHDLSFVSLGNTESKIIKSDAAGKVVLNLYPGSLPGPIEIKATLVSDPTIFALTKSVSVATGRVSQNGLSLAVSKNSLQWDVDGDKATITARLRDRVGNKVPNGTVISFVSEGGSITPNCSTADGECSVTLQTQNPRPLDNRVTVLAFVEGDKQYIDKDSDNRYTAGIDELVSNIGDFFRDDNENTIFEAALGEFLYKRGATGATCAPSTFKQPNIAGTCNTGLEAVIREQLVFAFSDDTPTVTSANINSDKTNFSFKLFGNTLRSVPMPTGTTVDVVAEDNTDKNELSCTAELWSGNPTVASVFNLLTPSTFVNSSQVNYSYRLKGCDTGDSLILSVTAPNGKITKDEFKLF
ncbi:MAG: hypothetical protein Q4F77_12335 [Acinetobacter sp.]|uniref:hypothetical protein n=1 Tax=Acinetobacter sp. TaxID=472 RepID=UPI0026E01C82|nr:hypothetical protein [Acinetobacter sp.]MDO5544071.1 hypothetical protein [Acinetobacter sp.]